MTQNPNWVSPVLLPYLWPCWWFLLLLFFQQLLKLLFSLISLVYSIGSLLFAVVIVSTAPQFCFSDFRYHWVSCLLICCQILNLQNVSLPFMTKYQHDTRICTCPLLWWRISGRVGAWLKRCWFCLWRPPTRKCGWTPKQIKGLAVIIHTGFNTQ